MEDGFVLLQGAVAQPLVTAATRLINGTLGEHGIDTEQLPWFETFGFCPELNEHPTIAALLDASTLRGTLQELFGKRDIPRAPPAQIALRFPVPDQEKRELEARSSTTATLAMRFGGMEHIDGLPSGSADAGKIRSFSCLVGVALSHTPKLWCGNLGVVRGGHKLVERFFRWQAATGCGLLGPGGDGWATDEAGRPTDYIPPAVRAALASAPGSYIAADCPCHQ